MSSSSLACMRSLAFCLGLFTTVTFFFLNCFITLSGGSSGNNHERAKKRDEVEGQFGVTGGPLSSLATDYGNISSLMTSN
uniref:Uncharacterized protein n=1 Tax=Solanum lycopersicum TaxID=4081 RepID=A0A3Q7GC35_SOLLC